MATEQIILPTSTCRPIWKEHHVCGERAADVWRVYQNSTIKYFIQKIKNVSAVQPRANLM